MQICIYSCVVWMTVYFRGGWLYPTGWLLLISRIIYPCIDPYREWTLRLFDISTQPFSTTYCWFIRFLVSFSHFATDWGANCYDQHVCMSAHSHISKTVCLNSSKFSVHDVCGHGLVLDLWLMSYLQSLMSAIALLKLLHKDHLFFEVYQGQL